MLRVGIGRIEHRACGKLVTIDLWEGGERGLKSEGDKPGRMRLRLSMECHATRKAIRAGLQTPNQG